MHRLLLTVLLLLPLAACGQPAAEIEVKDAWTRATVGEVASAAVFMTIASPTGDRLVAASTPVAAETDLMTMHVDSNSMTMAYVDDIPIPPGAREYD